MMLLSVIAVAGALLLTAAGIGHLRHRSGLRAALAAQGLLSRRYQRPVAALTTVLELVVGGSVLAIHLAPTVPVPVRAVPLIAQAGMYLTFSAYLSAVRRRRPSAPCGCFGTGGRVTWLLVGRAGLLAAGTAGAAVGSGFRDGTHTAPAAPLVVLAGAAVVAMAAWLVPVLPAAVSPPGRPAPRSPE